MNIAQIVGTFVVIESHLLSGKAESKATCETTQQSESYVELCKFGSILWESIVPLIKLDISRRYHLGPQKNSCVLTHNSGSFSNQKQPRLFYSELVKKCIG